MPSEEKYLKISFDAKIGFVFTVPHEATEDEGYHHTFQMDLPSRSIEGIQERRGEERRVKGRGGKQIGKEGKDEGGSIMFTYLKTRLSTDVLPQTLLLLHHCIHLVAGYFLAVSTK